MPALCLLVMVGMAHLWLLGWRPIKPLQRTQAPSPPAVTVRLAVSMPSKPAQPVATETATRQLQGPRSPAAPRGKVVITPTAESTPQQALDLRPHLPAPVVLDLLWQQGPVTRPAKLHWQIEANRFMLSLETTPDPPARSASWLRSQGSVQALGLAPARHTVRRAPASERALTFIREGAQVEVAFSAHTYTRLAPADVQDALSWLPQWLARLAAGRAEQTLEVAHVEGHIHPWQFTPDAADPWHWQTTDVPDQTRAELWLSPEVPHWPTRMIITPAWGAAWVLRRPTPQTGAPDE